MFTVDVATLDGFALVPVFLALAERYDDLDIFFVGQKLGWHDSHTGFFMSSQ